MPSFGLGHGAAFLSGALAVFMLGLQHREPAGGARCASAAGEQLVAVTRGLSSGGWVTDTWDESVLFVVAAMGASHVVLSAAYMKVSDASRQARPVHHATARHPSHNPEFPLHR